MKYKVGDKIKVFDNPSLKSLVVEETGCDNRFFIIKKAQPCDFYHICDKNRTKICSGNTYSFIGDRCRGNIGWCRVEEQSEFYVWKPQKPKQFKVIQ